jgi:hypothetical protein
MSIDASHKAYEKLMQEKQKLDDQILENQSTQTTIEKGAQNVWKLAERLKAQTHEKEIKYGEIMNEGNCYSILLIIKLYNMMVVV